MLKLLGLLLALVFASAVGADFSLGANERPLHPEQAYVFDAQRLAPGRYRVEFAIQPNYYLYKNKLALQAPAGLALGDVQSLGQSELKSDPFFGEQQVYYQYAGMEFSVYSTGADEGDLRVEYQGCWEGGICYPVEAHLLPVSTRPELERGAPTTAGASAASFDFADTHAFTRLLQGQNLALIAALFFVGGLLLAFTPCVLPMVPIVSAMLMGQRDANLARRLTLSSSYVVAMASVYAALGVASGLIGVGLQNYLQHPALIVLFTLLLLGLAGAMFGLYELRLPASWQRWGDARLSRSNKGGIVYALSLGVISALLVSPCVSAPLAGALLFIAQQGDASLGGIALFSLGLGMGAPLIAIGAGYPRLIPKTGAWMLGVQRAFGVLLVLLAIYMLDRLIADSLSLLLYGAVLIVTAGYMWRSSQRWLQAFGVLVLVYGLLYTLGASLGGGNPWRPLERLAPPALDSEATTTTASPATAPAKLDYHARVDTPAQLAQTLADLATDAQAGPPLLYFTAEWCVSCQELSWFTFSDPRVRQSLANFSVIEIDVTSNNEDTRQLLRDHGAFGPPALIFLDDQNQAREQHSVMSFLKPEAMLAALRSAAS